MTGCKPTTLGRICSKIGSGATPTGGSNAYQEAGIPLIRSQNVLDFSFSEDGLAFINDDQAFELRNVTVEENDVLLNITGDSVARCCVVPKSLTPARVNQHVAILRPVPEKASHLFVFYLLQQMKEELLMKSEIGATRRALTKGMLESLEIELPPLPEQKAIAAVLSSLDDKIDLLHRQNKTLEAMAETLFRQWFVEEARGDWKVEKLGECVTISYGKNLPTKNLIEEGFPVFGANGQIGFFDRYTYEDPQVLVSCRGEASGKVNISLPKSFITNNSLVLERNKHLEISFEYLKYWAYSYDFNLHVSGSAQPQITIDGLYDAEFLLPDTQSILKFSEIVRPIEERRNSNVLQLRTLEKLRDTLLPKLMSGEVRIEI